MNVELFINLVFEHKCLWDPNKAAYHSRDDQRRAWQKISEEIKIPVDDMKKKWRNLRDTYGKELKKCNSKKTNLDGPEPESKWIFFKKLSFLQPAMFRKMNEGKSGLVDVSATSDVEEYEIEDSGSTSQDYPSPIAFISSEQFVEQLEQKKRPLKRKITNPLDEFEVKAEMQENLNDADAQFLMSLLPFLRDIPKHRKLIVRSMLQQVLINEQNE